MVFQKQQLIFDLDDTLIYCNKHFMFALDQFCSMMHCWFSEHRIDSACIKQKQLQLDTNKVSQFGFSSAHFPESLVETYDYFCERCNRTAYTQERRAVYRLGMNVYEHNVEPYPAMNEVLDALREAGHVLYLYTGGEAIIQQRKINALKLSTYFENRIFIRQHKNAEALEQILHSSAFDRNVTWMIGNSIRTDIMPAVRAGIHSIYIKHPNEWSFNVTDLEINTDVRMHTITCLDEIIDLFRQKNFL